MVLPLAEDCSTLLKPVNIAVKGVHLEVDGVCMVKPASNVVSPLVAWVLTTLRSCHHTHYSTGAHGGVLSLL